MHIDGFTLCTGNFPHLSVCVSVTWQEFGRRKATAGSELIELAKQLAGQTMHTLPEVTAVMLARGAEEIVAALELAGGVLAVAKADAAAAACLARALTQAIADRRRRHWVPLVTRQRVEHAFADLGPPALRAAIADMHSNRPGALQQACVAAGLSKVFLQADGTRREPGGQLSRHMTAKAARARRVRWQALCIQSSGAFVCATRRHVPVCLSRCQIPAHMQ
jgi:hypothetical protein